MLFSEPKIPQLEEYVRRRDERRCFSALQRAENSSTIPIPVPRARRPRFSALQRAENSSTWPDRQPRLPRPLVSVLFSEPKIPQLTV